MKFFICYFLFDLVENHYLKFFIFYLKFGLKGFT